MKILLVTPRADASTLTMVARRFASDPEVRVIEDRRKGKRRVTPHMRNVDRRRRERRGRFFQLVGAVVAD